MRLIKNMPDGTIAPYGYQHAKRMAVDDVHAFELCQHVQFEGQTHEVTLIDRLKGEIGIAVYTNDWPGKSK